jgi:hypothetical protein
MPGRPIPQGICGVPLLNTLYGFRVVVDASLADRVQFRFPKTWKKRIRKKWAKRPENYRVVPRKDVYRVGDRLLMHPALWEELKKAVRESQSVREAAHRSRQADLPMTTTRPKSPLSGLLAEVIAVRPPPVFFSNVIF